MNDDGEYVGVTTTGHRREEVPAHHGAPLCKASGLDRSLGPFDDMGQIKEDATGGWGSLQNSSQQRSVPAAYIDNRPKRREVVGRDYCRGGLRRERRHGRIEDRRLVRMLRQVRKDAHPKEMIKGDLARLDAV